jgi:glycosyltransferase involved in cell wall biosynthesis
MKIIYLTWGETPRSYGVFGGQAIRQFVNNCELIKDAECHFISAVPLIHSGFVREKLRYFGEIKKIKFLLGNISFSWIPIYATQNFVNSNRFTFKLMHGLAHLHLLKKIKEIKPDIIHCRSYHAAWAALTVRKKYGLNFKVIFDGRGSWPEEMAFIKNWSENSADHQFLKSIEKTLLFECDVSVSMSDEMHQHYMDLGAKNDQCIYLSADTNQLKVDLDQIQQNEMLRFCYVGALSDNTWHQPKGLVDLYRRLRTLYPKTQLTIVTTSSHNQLKAQFSEFPKEELVFTSTKTTLELKQVLEKQDFGIFMLFTPINKLEKIAARMGLGTKTAEYFAAGLPVICNAYCGGAEKLIDNHGLGITYFPENVDSIKSEELLAYLNTGVRQKCQEFALKNFDYSLNARKYFELYKLVLNCQ